jgi:hypothetical protein
VTQIAAPDPAVQITRPSPATNRWAFWHCGATAVGCRPLHEVSKWLGHSTFTLTLDVYGDYIQEQDGGAANTLPEPPAPAESDNVVNLFAAQAG